MTCFGSLSLPFYASKYRVLHWFPLATIPTCIRPPLAYSLEGATEHAMISRSLCEIKIDLALATFNSFSKIGDYHFKPTPVLNPSGVPLYIPCRFRVWIFVLKSRDQQAWSQQKLVKLLLELFYTPVLPVTLFTPSSKRHGISALQ